MRFPSLDLLAARGAAVLRRFPWTILAGATAAACAIVATTRNGAAEEPWIRAALVAALGISATIAIRLLAEARGWSAAVRFALPALGLAALVPFYLAWPGPETKHDALRFVQLAAVLHLAVAALPFLGARETPAFWQYNRRLFLGFLRAGVFSAVLFVGVAIALAALDQLFGVDVDEESYVRIWFVAAFVVNTWIFLAAVPEDLDALEHDLEYPRALKIFAQYVLTPLAFSYLLILLAYLVKLVAGAEWPSGWIGWLVTSVALTGLLGFLLVHPLRNDPAEGWIRIYARWLFVGLMPAAIMLLVAFWKRIVPYGLTEPRVLGILLGVWLFGIALWYTLRPASGIRLIPVSLGVLLLATLYGPLSLTRISVASQRDRLAELLPGAATSRDDAREASAALRFLVEHGAGREIAQATGRALPAVRWDSVDTWTERDSLARLVMTSAGARYVPEHAYGGPGGEEPLILHARAIEVTSLAGFDWMVRAGAGDTTVRVAGADSVRVAYDSTSGIARVRVGRDTFAFDLEAIALRAATDPSGLRRAMPAELLSADTMAGGRRARLRLDNVIGRWEGDSARVQSWSGVLLVGGVGGID